MDTFNHVGMLLPLQVQDVGLIFLSAIASDIVSDCARVGVSESDTIGTVLVGLSLVTIIIGTAIIITGMLKFASLVQFCPVPVVGGYLAYVGVFCFMAGVSQSTAVGSLTSLSSLAKLLDINVGIHLVPCLVLTAILLGIQRRCRSPFVLPSLLVAVPVLFYCVLWLGDWSVEDAQRNGWLVPPETFDDHWRPWSIWKLYSIHSWPPTNIYWASLPRQIGKVLGLYVAVACKCLGSQRKDLTRVFIDEIHTTKASNDLHFCFNLCSCLVGGPVLSLFLGFIFFSPSNSS